jgi:hypothetical protein
VRLGHERIGVVGIDARSISPPWPLTPTDMLLSIRNARPPNICFSVRPRSAAISSRMRLARSWSYAMRRMLTRTTRTDECWPRTG